MNDGRSSVQLLKTKLPEKWFIWAVVCHHLSDIGALGLSRPGDDAGHGQPGLTGVYKVWSFHLQSQRLDVLQDGHLYLEYRKQGVEYH